MPTPAEIAEAKARAESTIRDTWREISARYSLGWGGPIEALEDAFPHVTNLILDIRPHISSDLPILIFQTRENPPEDMVMAVPFWRDTGNPYNSRLIEMRKLNPKQQHLFSMFAQSFWFAIEHDLLPSPWDGAALQDAVTKWTGPEFLA